MKILELIFFINNYLLIIFIYLNLLYNLDLLKS